LKKIFPSEKVAKIVESLTIVKGVWEMFGFFSDLKNRLVALEQKIEVVWHHLFSVVEQDQETLPAPEAAPAADEEVPNNTEKAEDATQEGK